MDKAIAQMLSEKVKARCANCGQVVELCFDERMRKRWTHYGCGRVHMSETYEKSIVR